jgi:hypothetical protein
MDTTQDTLSLEISLINGYLNDAFDYGLDTEVVAAALLAMKSDPSLSISNAMAVGYSEWVK